MLDVIFKMLPAAQDHVPGASANETSPADDKLILTHSLAGGVYDSQPVFQHQVLRSRVRLCGAAIPRSPRDWRRRRTKEV